MSAPMMCSRSSLSRFLDGKYWKAKDEMRSYINGNPLFNLRFVVAIHFWIGKTRVKLKITEYFWRTSGCALAVMNPIQWWRVPTHWGRDSAQSNTGTYHYWDLGQAVTANLHTESNLLRLASTYSILFLSRFCTFKKHDKSKYVYLMSSIIWGWC